MLQINLLPEKFQSQIRSFRIRNALIEVTVFCVIIIVLAAVGILLLSYTFGSMSKNTAKEIEKQKKFIQNYSDFEDEIRTYQENSNLYDEVLKTHFNWSDILIHITQLTPAELQISQMSIDTEGKATDANRISFSGKALSRRDVAKFVKKLEDSEKFAEVELVSSSLDQEGKADFQINAKLTKK